MKFTALFLFGSLVWVHCEAQCPWITGTDLFRPDEIMRLRDMPYTKNKEAVDQMMDLYFPSPVVVCDEVKLIMIIHGGGFEGGDKDQMVNWGYYFARKGYHVAILNYRLYMSTKEEMAEYLNNPFNFLGGQQCKNLSAVSSQDGIYKIDKAWYFAIQDSWAALAYMQHRLEKHGKKIKQFYLMGESAGAISALGMAFGQQADFNAYNPSLEENFGSLTSRTAYQSAEPVKIDAVVSFSGGMLNARHFISAEDTVPVIFFHGGNDVVVPLCEDNCFFSERRLNGPLKIAEIADSLQLSLNLQMYLWATEGHDMEKKYPEMSRMMMHHLSDEHGPKSIAREIKVYPEKGSMYDCNTVESHDVWRTLTELTIDDTVQLSVYPNPSNGIFSLKLATRSDHSIRIEVYDVQGRMVHGEDNIHASALKTEVEVEGFFEKTHFPRVKSQLKLNLQHLRPGLYELVLIDENLLAGQLRLVIE